MSTLMLDILGHQLQFSQDPNLNHLGTTVWDASIVFVKFLEKNFRKGKFSHDKLKGKRVIELGAGCGLAGLGMAMLGCDVVATDQMEVLPLLRRNVDRNTSSITQTNDISDCFGSIQIAELDWTNPDYIKALDPPFDFVIGTDVVYTEQLMEPLTRTIYALSGPRTTIMMAYEVRCELLHQHVMKLWKSMFDIKLVPRAKMDSKYQHASIKLYTLNCKRNTPLINECQLGSYSEGCSFMETLIATHQEKRIGEDVESVQNSTEDSKLDEWNARRLGSLAARLLRDVKIR